MTTKITELIRNASEIISYEVTPDVNEEDLDLCKPPLFISVTWHAKTHQCENLDIAPLRLACRIRKKGKNVLLHLSCDLLKKGYLEKLLKHLQNKDICNLFLILGERYDPIQSDFSNTKDLVAYIRDKTGDYFCIGVAGYPGHDATMTALKEKVDSGADFIITQAVFEFHIYKIFVQKCEEIGINVPVITGMFLFETYEQLVSFKKLCKVNVSNSVLEYVINHKSDESPGWNIIKSLMQGIKSYSHQTESGVNFHFFSLNKLQNLSRFLTYLEIESASV